MTQQTDYDARRVTVMVPVLASFLNIDKPRRVKRGGREVGEPKYSVSLEFEPDSPDLAAIRAKIVSQAQAEFPGKDVPAAIRDGKFLVPIEDGDKLADKAKQKAIDAGTPDKRLREWSRGKKVLTARTAKAPGVAVVRGGQIVQLEDAAAVTAARSAYFYTGVKVLAELDFVAYAGIDDGLPGVACYLSSICSTGKGEKLIKEGRDLASTFSGYQGLDSDEDPTAKSSADW